ncbi:phage portal protein family protein [Shigella boydii]|uniref:phage portal protein family protein n=1 Tax=Shigella boydii TaxID=621 RepID=UPI003D79FE0E
MVAASDDDADVQLADAIRALMEAPQIPELMFDLLDGLGKGVAVCEILWDTRNNHWMPRDYEWVDPRFLKAEKPTLRQFRLLTDDEPVDGVPLTPGKFIVHQPRLKSGLPRVTVGRLVAVMYMLKSLPARLVGICGKNRHSGYGGNTVPTHGGANPRADDAIASIASDAGVPFRSPCNWRCRKPPAGKRRRTVP